MYVAAFVVLAAVSLSRNAGFCTYCWSASYNCRVPVVVCNEFLSQPCLSLPLPANSSSSLHVPIVKVYEWARTEDFTVVATCGRARLPADCFPLVAAPQSQHRTPVDSPSSFKGPYSACGKIWCKLTCRTATKGVAHASFIAAHNARSTTYCGKCPCRPCWSRNGSEAMHTIIRNKGSRIRNCYNCTKG